MIKHNKKMNAGIVYEQLISLITRLATEKKHKEANFVLEVVKKYFGKNTLLGKERRLITSMIENQGYSKKDAERILNETLEEIKKIPEDKLKKEKLALINTINKDISKDLYSISLKNYKDLASIQILFNEARNGYKYTTPKERIKIQNKILETITKSPTINKDIEVDNFTFKVLVEKFNKKYNKLINEDQKEILKGWLQFLIDSNENSLKKLLESKIEKIKLILSKNLDAKKHKNEKYGEMLKEAYAKIINFNIKQLNESVVYEIMRFFDVCEDLDIINNEEMINE